MAEDRQTSLIAISDGGLPPSDQWPKGLRKLLTEGEDAGAAIRLIGLNPTLRRECEAMLPALQAAKAPADGREILSVLVRQAPVYALPTRPDHEWAAFFGAYLDALTGLSVHCLEDAFVRWNRGEDMKDPAMGQFFPKPSQLYALAHKAKTQLWLAAYRAEKALAHAERQAPRKVSEEERKRVAEEMRALAEQLGGKALAERRPGVSPQQMAEAIRASTEAAKRDTPDDDPGEVI